MIEYENLKEVNVILFNQYRDVFNDFLNSGWYILGKNVQVFEQEFANYCNTEYSVGVASGLDALILAIDAFDFEKGSEIIVPSNTYIATILAIVRNGLTPVLIEPDISTYNIDPEKIAEKITKKTKAILVVHLYGKSCDMETVGKIASDYQLEIIEDAAQAHGAMFKNKKVGSFGTGCFSFYPTKNLGALGDAGAITSNNKSYIYKLKSLRNYGSIKKYHNDDLGYNSRLDEIQAAFLSCKLKIIDEINAHKRNLAALYLDGLSSDFIKPVVNSNYHDVYHIFNIRFYERDNLQQFLLKNNIKTEIHYPVPPHKQKAMQNFISGNYPLSEEIHNTTLSLPISFSHTEKDVFKVIDTMNSYLIR